MIGWFNRRFHFISFGIRPKAKKEISSRKTSQMIQTLLLLFVHYYLMKMIEQDLMIFVDMAMLMLSIVDDQVTNVGMVVEHNQPH
jgi:hypothetical protein